MRFLKLVAFFIIWLVVFLPVAFAQSSATLTVTKYSGNDGVDGFINVQDRLYIDATAFVPGETSKSVDQLKICYEGSCASFDSCDPLGNNYFNCSFRGDISWHGGSFNIVLRLHDASGSIVVEKVREFVVDNIPPVVKSFSLNTNYSKGPVVFSYEVEDYGVEYGNPSKCSGIKNVVFTANGAPIVTDYGEKGVCSKKRTFTYDFDPDGSQFYNICVRATDFLGRSGDFSCKTVIVDNAGPVISDFSFNVDGAKITHIKSGSSLIVSPTVKVVDDSEILISDVSANFFGSGFIKPSFKESDYFLWRSLNIQAPEDSFIEFKPLKVVVRAKDVLGNEAEKEFSVPIPLDDVSPVVKEFKTQRVTAEGLPLLGYDTDVIVVFEDKDNAGNPGVGFNSAKAFLDLASLGLESKVKANFCVDKGNSLWECRWRIKPPQTTRDGSYNIVLLSDSQDDLGNKLEDSKTLTIKYDNTPPKTPVLVSFDIISSEDRNVLTRGDSVKFVLRSSDFVRAVANFTDIGGRSDVQGICEDVENSDDVDCIFQSEVFDSGSYKAVLEFFFFDEADNKAVFRKEVSVYSFADDTNPNFWSYTLECSPRSSEQRSVPLIDRTVASQIHQIVSCKISLHKKSSLESIKVASISGPTSVEACTANESLYFEDVFLTNAGYDSQTPMLMFRLSKAEFDINQTNISCPIYITTELNNSLITRVPERKDINVTFKFYNQPLGNIYSNWEKQIDDKLKDIEGWREWLGGASDVVSFAEGVCQWKELLTNVVGGLQAVVATLGIADDLDLFGFVSPAYLSACEAAEDISEVTDNWFTKIINPFCAIVSCQAIVSDDSKWGYVGGGAPWCTDIEKFISEEIFKVEDYDALKKAGIPMGPGLLNVKDSLVWSAVCLCLPSLIHNANKILQNECQYVNCLMEDYLVYGMPRSFCSDQYSYIRCAYIIGEIWNIIPASQLWNMLGDMIANWIADPFSFAGTVAGWFCRTTCPLKPSTLHTLCAIPKVMSWFSEAIMSIELMIDTKSWYPQGTPNNYCDRTDDLEKKYKDAKS